MSNLFLPAPKEGSWQKRAIRATDGNNTLLGCFVLAILGLSRALIAPYPRFGSTAIIDKDGLVYSNMQDKDGRMYRNHCLGPIEDIRDNFRGLADHLKLSDNEREGLFSDLKKWRSHDARADQTAEERGLAIY